MRSADVPEAGALDEAAPSDAPLAQFAPPALTEFVRQVNGGVSWPSALVDAIGCWTLPRENVDGEELTYLLAGEAFDWLLLAERLLRGLESEVPGVVPAEDRERLLFRGALPSEVTPARFREALGVDKYRAHLNFFYGVVVEEALWEAVEREVQKERGVRGLRHQHGVLDMVFGRLYRADFKTLARRFRRERGERPSVKFTLSEWKEFTYSLFRYRMGNHDSSRIASDTRKGLDMLEEIWGVPPQAQGGLGLDPLSNGR